MKTITIDFTKSPAEISDKVLGHQGEKNATELVITPPTEMSENADIVSYAVAFQIGAYKVHHSAIYEKAESITVPVEQKVSKVNVISLQLEGYDGEENVLVKSERIDDLVFEASVVGEEDDSEAKSELIEQIVKMKEDILNGPPYKTITLDQSMFMGIDNGNGNSVTLCLCEEVIPVNTEIKTIRFNYNNQMVDIKNMMEIDDIPYILNMTKIYISLMSTLPTLAVISNWNGANTLIQALLNFEIPNIEIDYYI